MTVTPLTMPPDDASTVRIGRNEIILLEFSKTDPHVVRTGEERNLLRSTLGWSLTAHARQSAGDRGFDLRDVLLTCADPEVAYSSFDHGPGRYVYQRGHLAVVVVPGIRRVITVLLRQVEQWTDAEARTINHSRNAA